MFVDSFFFFFTEFFLAFLFKSPVNGYSYVFVNKLFKENFDITLIRNIKDCKKKKKISYFNFSFFIKIFSKLMALGLHLNKNYK